MYFEILAKFRHKIKMESHEEGRIVLSVKASLMFESEVQALVKTEHEKPFYIKDIAFDLLSKSVSISYDTAVIPSDSLEGIFTSKDDAEALACVVKLNDCVAKASA